MTRLPSWRGKVAATLDQPFLIDGRYFNISSSIGITLYPDDGASSSEILKNADIAMYAAKQSGRNQYAFFSPQMNQELYERLEILQGRSHGTGRVPVSS